MSVGETLSLEAAFGQAALHHQAGRFTQAEELYRVILAAHPEQPDTHHNLGILLGQSGQSAAGLPHLKLATLAQPTNTPYMRSYVETLLNLNEPVQALEVLGESIAKNGSAVAVQDLLTRGVIALTGNEVDRLAGLFNIASYPEMEKLAILLVARFAEFGVGWKALAIALQVQKKPSLQAFGKAMALLPDDAELYSNLGIVYHDQGQYELAIKHFDSALNLNKNHVETHNNLASSLIGLGRLDAALDSVERALQIDSTFAMAYCNRAVALSAKGRFLEAEESYRKGIALQPKLVVLRSGLLFLRTTTDTTAFAHLSIFAEHVEFGRMIEEPHINLWPRHSRTQNPSRALRVGFVSGDFRRHAIASFIEPVLAELIKLNDDNEIVLCAYVNQIVEDSTTLRFKGMFSHWRDVFGWQPDILAELLRSDKIDILIDLSGHTEFNCLPTFARKPAPIQVSWMGYPGTTGLQAMDYYLSDQYFLPPGQFDDQFTEKIVHLPASAPFLPIADAPPVGPLPALANGFITFGSFNRPNKISQPVVALWSELLHALPDSRMVLGAMPTGSDNKVLVDWFAAEGVDAKRLSFYAACAIPEYLALHHQVDVCLDTFPYNGGTTTLHALWMGVPTLTLAGGTAAGRTGTAILGHLGLQDFVARSKPDFFSKGLALASDLKALAATRAEMRSRFEASAIGQPAVVADGLVRALRIMWQRWCAGLPAESFVVV